MTEEQSNLLHGKIMANVRTKMREPGALEAKSSEHVLRMWNEEDPRSVIRLVPESIRASMLAIPNELKELDEWDLRTRFKEQFTATHYQLRLAFWLEYQRAQDDFQVMRLLNIFRGICSEEVFYKWIKRPHIIALLLCPPQSYNVAMEEALNLGIERMREIIALPLYEEKFDKASGKMVKRINTAVATLVIKAAAYMDMRKNGAITQRIEMKSQTMNLNLEQDSKEVMAAIGGRQDTKMEVIEKRLKYLEKKEKQITEGTPMSGDIEVVGIPVKTETTSGDPTDE